MVRDVLRVELDRLDREANDALGDWPQQYVAALRSLMEDYRQSGNFNAWEAVSTELVRFEETSQLHAEDIFEHPEGLRQTQETFLLQRRAVTESCEAEKRKAYRNALTQLETLKSDLTKQGEMNSASAVNQVIRAIQTEPRYLALERSPTSGAKKSAAAPEAETKPAAASSNLQE
jgi:hypothetical protein